MSQGGTHPQSQTRSDPLQPRDVFPLCSVNAWLLSCIFRTQDDLLWTSDICWIDVMYYININMYYMCEILGRWGARLSWEGFCADIGPCCAFLPVCNWPQPIIGLKVTVRMETVVWCYMEITLLFDPHANCSSQDHACITVPLSQTAYARDYRSSVL